LNRAKQQKTNGALANTDKKRKFLDIDIYIPIDCMPTKYKQIAYIFGESVTYWL